MGIKSVPIGYLAFSRAIGGNHAHTRAAAAHLALGPGLGSRVRTWAWGMGP